MPTFSIPDNFTITDAEFAAQDDNQQVVYRDEGGRQADRSYVDPLGRGRWTTDYITLRFAGYSHEAAMQEVRVRIREAWRPSPLPAREPHVPAPPPPRPTAPGGSTGLITGPGNVRAPWTGAKLPLPAYGEAVVRSVGRVFPHFLQHSCQHAGGTWDFLDWAVDTLRTHDLRWGYNAKRGNMHDPSMDVVAYHWGPEPVSEGSSNVYIVDIIGGHCGPSPSVVWNDVTALTLSSGAIGRFLSRGRF